MDIDTRRQTLVVEEEGVNIDSMSSEIQTFTEENDGINYIFQNCKYVDLFDVYIHGRHADRLLQSGVCQLEQVKRFTLFFDSINDMRQAKQKFSEMSPKFKFCLKTEVANRVRNNHTFFDLISVYPRSQRTLKSDIEARRHQVQVKQQGLSVHGFSTASLPRVGFNARNISTIDRQFLCDFCLYILRDPVQLSCCGTRLCQLCVENFCRNTVRCPECYEEMPKINIHIDKGCQIEMRTLDINCSLCNWNGQFKEYENHLHQCHPICEYCDEMFESAEHLTVHQRSNCSAIIVPCVLKDYGCSNTIKRSEMNKHYLTEEHQLAVIKVIRHLSDNMSDIRYENQFQADATQLQGANELINVFASGIQALNDEAQQLNAESLRTQNTVDTISWNYALVESSTDQQNINLSELECQLQSLQQDIALLQEVGDMPLISYDGTLVWKITNVCEKMENARCENQISIDSPPFYSSDAGYKMRARLYLCGDGHARRTHMSLFFVLMRGLHDAILQWPFHYKVTFCLYDQTPAQRHIIDSFRPDIKSISFQRPRSGMNIAIGIPKFVPLAMIEQENNPYVQNNTIFLKVMVDFKQIPDDLLPYTFSLNPGIPTHKQYEMIQREIDKSH